MHRRPPRAARRASGRRTPAASAAPRSAGTTRAGCRSPPGRPAPAAGRSPPFTRRVAAPDFRTALGTAFHRLGAGVDEPTSFDRTKAFFRSSGADWTRVPGRSRCALLPAWAGRRTRPQTRLARTPPTGVRAPALRTPLASRGPSLAAVIARRPDPESDPAPAVRAMLQSPFPSNCRAAPSPDTSAACTVPK